MPTSSKGKEKETSETILKKRPYLTIGTTKELMSDAMKERKVHNSMDRRLMKDKIIKDLVRKTNVVDLSQDGSENK